MGVNTTPPSTLDFTLFFNILPYILILIFSIAFIVTLIRKE